MAYPFKNESEEVDYDIQNFKQLTIKCLSHNLTTQIFHEPLI